MSEEKNRQFYQAVETGDLGAVKWFIADGDIDLECAFSKNHWTPLMHAARLGHTEIAELLLEAGANPSARSRTPQNLSPIAIATFYDRSDILAKLLDVFKERPRDLMAELSLRSLYYEHPTSEERTPFFTARNLNHTKCIALILGAARAAQEQLPTEKVAVIGAGFSGTTMAAELFPKRYDPRTMEVVLIESNEANRGGGLAYSTYTADPEHLVNVHELRMSPSLGPERHTEWRDRKYASNPSSRVKDGMPRTEYQEFLLDYLDAKREFGPLVTFTPHNGRVVDIDKNPDGSGTLKFADGTTMKAQQIVLATGHLEPRSEAFFAPVEQHERFLISPLGPKARSFMDGIGKNDSVFIVGTGMSAYDILLSLKKREHEGDVVMMSRHGYMHHFYDEKRVGPVWLSLDRPAFVDATTLPALIEGIKTEWAQITTATQNTPYNREAILNNWEQYLPEVIERLVEHGTSYEDIARAMREYKSLIDTTRIGVSYHIGKVVLEAIKTGKLRKWTGKIEAMNPSPEGGITVEYEIQTRGGTAYENNATFDHVISGLGMETDYTRLKDPLIHNLMEKGMITPHWTDIGIAVSENGDVIGADGKPSHLITAIGVIRAGNTMVRVNDYTEKLGRGGRLGPLAFSVAGIRSHFEDLANHVTRRLAEYAETPEKPPVSMVEKTQRNKGQGPNIGRS